MTLPFFANMVVEASEQIASLTFHPTWFDEHGSKAEILESKSKFVRYATENYPAALDQLEELAERISEIVSMGRHRLDSLKK